MPGERPRVMANEAVREERRKMLGLPHMTPLSEYTRSLRMGGDFEVPDFDPMDGGIAARLLFLFEKPGPMTSSSKTGRIGSGFISRDNDDPTAEATFNFMLAAKIPRKETLLWNVVPGWNGTRKVTAAEVNEGVNEVGRLLELLPQVRTIVLVGRKAARAEARLTEMGIRVFHSAHPSPLVRASRPDAWRAIPSQWRLAFEHAYDAAVSSGH